MSTSYIRIYINMHTATSDAQPYAGKLQAPPPMLPPNIDLKSVKVHLFPLKRLLDHLADAFICFLRCTELVPTTHFEILSACMVARQTAVMHIRSMLLQMPLKVPQNFRIMLKSPFEIAEQGTLTVQYARQWLANNGAHYD